MQSQNGGLALRAQQLAEAMRNLEASRERYVDLFDTAPIAYVLWDGDGLIEDINLTGAEMLGSHRGQLIGRPFLSLVHEADRRILLEHLRSSRESGKTLTCELRIRTLAGDLVPLEVTTRRASSGTLHFRNVLIDLTQRRHAEEERRRAIEERSRAQAASEAKDRFLATLSHELRTPLTPVFAAVSALAEHRDLPRGWKPTFDMLLRNLDIESRLIDDLLDVTRIVRNKLKLDMATADLHTIALDIVDLWQDQFDEKKIELEVALRADRYHVHGDAARLRQVFWNLLTNALKFTPEGGSVSLRSENVGADIRFAVSDSGIGMDAAALEQAFRPFEQGEQAAGARGLTAGLGLGLSICKGIVEAHGGTIRASSAGLGRGTTFAIELATVDAPLEAPPIEAAPAEVPRGRARTILLVEDHPDSALLLSKLLRSAGYGVLVANNAAAARELAARGFDLLISDISLPDTSGWDLMRELSQSGPVHAIAFSGLCSDEDFQKSRAAGFAEHLTKPIDFRKLREAIERVFAEPPETSSPTANIGQPG